MIVWFFPFWQGTQSILLAIVIALSCLVVVSLIMNGVFIWQRRRAVKSSPDQQSSDQQASVPSLYLELKPRPTNQQSHVPTEYQSLQENPEIPDIAMWYFREKTVENKMMKFMRKYENSTEDVLVSLKGALSTLVILYTARI